MCLDAYLVSTIVEQRLDEARAEAERQRLIAELKMPFNVTVGHALIRLGHRLANGVPARVQPSLG